MAPLVGFPCFLALPAAGGVGLLTLRGAAAGFRAVLRCDRAACLVAPITTLKRTRSEVGRAVNDEITTLLHAIRGGQGR